MSLSGAPALARHVSLIRSSLPSLTVSDLAPNVGMWWYFFTEMFDHFRAFFLGVFQVGPVPTALTSAAHAHIRRPRLHPATASTSVCDPDPRWRYFHLEELSDAGRSRTVGGTVGLLSRRGQR